MEHQDSKIEDEDQNLSWFKRLQQVTQRQVSHEESSRGKASCENSVAFCQKPSSESFDEGVLTKNKDA